MKIVVPSLFKTEKLTIPLIESYSTSISINGGLFDKRTCAFKNVKYKIGITNIINIRFIVPTFFLVVHYASTMIFSFRSNKVVTHWEIFQSLQNGPICPVMVLNSFVGFIKLPFL